MKTINTVLTQSTIIDGVETKGSQAAIQELLFFAQQRSKLSQTELQKSLTLSRDATLSETTSESLQKIQASDGKWYI
jgi:hypothetical protein